MQADASRRVRGGEAQGRGTVLHCWSVVSFPANYQQGRPTSRLGDFEHAVKGYPGPVFDVVFYLDLVDHVAFDQVFEGPAEVLRGDAEHGGAEATGVVEGDHPLPLFREFSAHAVDEVYFRAHREHCSFRGLADHLQQAFGRADPVGFLADFPAAFRMNDDADAGIPGADVVDVLREETLVDRAVAFPQNYPRLLEAIGSEAAVNQVGIPDDHFVERDAHRISGVAAEVLIGEEENLFVFFEGPLEGCGGVR